MNENVVKVIVVDDDTTTLKFLSAQLETISHPTLEVECCQFPTEAQEKIQACSYDLLICDLNMPECPGDELLRFALENSANQRLALAAMTAHSPDEVSRFYQVPENTTVICKPVERSVLFSLILAVNAAKCLTKID